MNLEAQLQADIEAVLKSQFDLETTVVLQPTRKEFEGTYTLVVFPFVKLLRKKPQDLAEAIGASLVEKSELVSSFNVVKGFLNLSLRSSVWHSVFNSMSLACPEQNSKVMVEFSSPNTNKPLHLGHLRNNFLGDSVSRILKAAGHEVNKTSLVNDRGVHICKSMYAYQKLGNGETPASAGMKGDHLVGKYYVLFDQMYKQEVAELLDRGRSAEQAKKEAPSLLAAQEMLVLWEQGDKDVVALWEQMNEWVFSGFNATYDRIDVTFDKVYRESDTYLLGKDIVEEGLAQNVFFKKDDGSVWINLEEEGLDEKLVLRGDGTSVYMTQDLGTTELKFKDFKNDRSIWVVGNEQDYHFKVLFAIMKKMGRSYADGCYHLSYGMVDLPSGKMKSREGTVVDADDLIDEMVATAKTSTEERGKIDDFTTEEAEQLHHTLAMGALKYFLLKVEPKKRMLFNPKESIDFQGNTGPFIQYTHARIKSILRRSSAQGLKVAEVIPVVELIKVEEEIIFLMNQYSTFVLKAAEEYAPSVIANYCYDLAKRFNSFYAEVSVMNEADEEKRAARLVLIAKVAETLKRGMALLGIAVPERM